MPDGGSHRRRVPGDAPLRLPARDGGAARRRRRPRRGAHRRRHLPRRCAARGRRHRRAGGGGRRDSRPRRRGADPRPALATDRRHRPLLPRHAGGGPLHRQRRLAGERGRDRRRPRRAADGRPLPEHPQQPHRPGPPAGAGGGAGGVGGEPRPVGGLRRGLRGLHLHRRAHLRPPARPRAHLLGLLLLQGVRHGRQPLRLRRGAARDDGAGAQGGHPHLLQRPHRLPARRPAGVRRGEEPAGWPPPARPTARSARPPPAGSASTLRRGAPSSSSTSPAGSTSAA